MSYLMIRNPGVTDSAAITLLGVSGTRYSGNSNTIGTFGSGSKHAIALCLRNNLNPVVVIGNLKMEFFSKPITVNGNYFNQVMVKYSGKDADGNTRNSTNEIGGVVEWGAADWNKLSMAFREFVANAIDGAILNGGSAKDVEFEIKDSPRAKAGYTSVFLPFTPEIQELWKTLPQMFLHFKNAEFLKMLCLPKSVPGYVHFYKKGVLVRVEKGNSVFDYNVEDLKLDESRNADPWDVKYAVAKALGNGSVSDVAKILLAQLSDKDLWENKLDASYLYNDYEDKDTRDKKAQVFQTAFKTIAGDTGILSQGTKHITEVIERKGFKPLEVSPSWFTALEKYGCANQNQVLEGLEKDGIPESEPTEDMLKALDKVWGLIVDCDMTNGKTKPPVKGFSPVMDAAAQIWGMYKNGICYIHTDLGGAGLSKVMLEEVAHHVTGASDMSRDFQDYLMRVIIKLWF